MTANLRNDIENEIEAGRELSALQLLKEYWKANAGMTAASFVLAKLDKLRPSLQEHLLTKKIFCLRSWTVEPLLPILRAEALLYGLDLQVTVGGFNAYAQEMLNPQSTLYADAADIVILTVEMDDLRPDLANGANGADTVATGTITPEATNLESATPNSGDITALAETEGWISNWLKAFRNSSQADLIIQNLASTKAPQAAAQLNTYIEETSKQYRGIYVIDYAALAAAHGASWRDLTKAAMYRLPISTSALRPLAQEWLRTIVPLCGKTCKAIVVDLDDTLWKGTAGEDGLQGVKVPQSFADLQKTLQALSSRGIILAAASKNNPQDALEILDKHPDMLLRSKDFSSLQINWEAKAANLTRIAAELNIGLDALAFLDNDPVERAAIKAALPQVFVIDISDDPQTYATTIDNLPVFKTLIQSQEDTNRSRYYQEDKLREDLRRAATSLDDFLASLNISTAIGPAQTDSFLRVAQLTQKTNQFNLTTRRYSEENIAAMAKETGVNIYQVKSGDRFGDHGLVGVAITKDEGQTCLIDTLLLSCRVIGRGIETALLARIASDCKNRGLTALVGSIVPTAKNMPAREFYAKHGFTRHSEEKTQENSTDNSESNWSLDLLKETVASPNWITLEDQQQL